MNYYREIGYDHDHGQKLQRDSGTEAMVAYWNQGHKCLVQQCWGGNRRPGYC